MFNTPHLLDQLVSLTGIRDLELLEASHPTGLSLYKVSNRGEVRSGVIFGSEKCQVLREGFDVSPELLQAFQQHHAADSSTLQLALADGFLNVMTVTDTRSATTYLVIRSKVALLDSDSRVIDGMLQIYRNFCQLLQESQTDSLTGLANRKTFDECFSRVYELQPMENDHPVAVDLRKSQSPTSYWIAMIDIDHFKSVNDRFGHLYSLAPACPHSPLMIRCHDREEAAGLLERLRKSVETQNIPQVGQVTISIGATEMIRNTFAGTLLDYADKALYFSKQNGRNRLTFFEDMERDGLATREMPPSENLDFF